MPDAQVQINHADILTQSSKLIQLKSELTSTLAACDAAIRNLHDSGAFTGVAGANFKESFNEWHRSAAQTVSLMDGFGQHLKKTSQAFADVDQSFKI
jgi:WXG100 family type VII secretion target